MTMTSPSRHKIMPKLPKLKLKKNATSSNETQSLYELLNIQQQVEDDSSQLDDEAVLAAIERDPKAISQKYNFIQFGEAYPLLPAICLGATWEVVNTMIDLYPEAVRVHNSDGGTLLHMVLCSEELYGCSNNTLQSDVVSLILSSYPQCIEIQNSKGNTPLHLACANAASFPVVRTLISKYNRALMAKNNKANTPLHEACINDAPVQVVRLMLEKNPGPLWVENCQGRTPLQTAEHWGVSEDVVELLRKWSRPSEAR